MISIIFFVGCVKLSLKKLYNMSSLNDNEIDENDHVVSNNLSMFQSVHQSLIFLEFRPHESHEAYSKKFECLISNSEYGLTFTNNFNMSLRIKLMAGSTYLKIKKWAYIHDL